MVDISLEMATIRTTCPACGEVDLNPGSVLVSVQGATGEGSYRFVCPKCLDAVEKRADRRIVALLRSVGVDVLEASAVGEDLAAEAPAAEPHPEQPPGGRPFTTDDVIAFHFLLQDDEALASLLASSE